MNTPPTLPVRHQEAAKATFPESPYRVDELTGFLASIGLAPTSRRHVTLRRWEFAQRRGSCVSVRVRWDWQEYLGEHLVVIDLRAAR